MEQKVQFNITQLVKNNFVNYAFYRANNMYYNINFENETYQFSVPLDDVGNGTLNATDKALTYMRWIRKAIADNTFIKVS
jgi:hypothetical protein